MKQGFFAEARPWMGPRFLWVFDDALVEVRAPRVFGLFGLLLSAGVGDWLQNTLVLRSFRKKLALVETLGPGVTSREFVSKVKGSRRILLSDVTSAEVKKWGRGRRWLLVVRTSARPKRWVVGDDAHEGLAGELAAQLGSRFVDESTPPPTAAAMEAT
jgi:hypothetical protein